MKCYFLDEFNPYIQSKGLENVNYYDLWLKKCEEDWKSGHIANSLNRFSDGITSSINPSNQINLKLSEVKDKIKKLNSQIESQYVTTGDLQKEKILNSIDRILYKYGHKAFNDNYNLFSDSFQQYKNKSFHKKFDRNGNKRSDKYYLKNHASSKKKRKNSSSSINYSEDEIKRLDDDLHYKSNTSRRISRNYLDSSSFSSSSRSSI